MHLKVCEISSIEKDDPRRTLEEAVVEGKGLKVRHQRREGKRTALFHHSGGRRGNGSAPTAPSNHPPRVAANTSALELKTFRSAYEVNAVIETPRGSRIKYKYEEGSGLFKLDKVLTAGTVFPRDYGFLPGTRGADGDPLDVLVLIEEPLSLGCLVPAKLIGVIEADQTEGRTTRRNPRLIAVASSSHEYRQVRSLRDIDSKVLDEIERFFVFYNEMQRREFKVRARHGAARALRLVHEGRAEFDRARKRGLVAPA